MKRCGYHGSPERNSRGVIQRFLGFWDANPATLIPLSPGDSAPLYVEMMGGADCQYPSRSPLSALRTRGASEVVTLLGCLLADSPFKLPCATSSGLLDVA